MTRIRSIAPFVALFLAGVLAVFLLLTAIRIGAAHGAPAVPEWAPLMPIADAQTAASTLPPPAPTAAAIDDADAAAARRLGWPVAVFAIVTMLALALGRAGERVPWLAWLARGTAATVLGAVAACGSAAFDVAVAGGSPMAVMTAAVAAILAFWRARRTEPAPGQERDRQRGSAPLVWLCSLSLLSIGAVSCAWLRSESRETVAVVVDCTIGAARQNADDLGPVLEHVVRAATSPDGVVDWTRVRDSVEALGWDVAQCALASVVAQLLAPAPAAARTQGLTVSPRPSDASVREGWERLRGEVLGGRRYRVASGVL